MKRGDAATPTGSARDQQSTRFWETKPLRDLTPAEWEALCDGCGRCCMLKVEDEDTGAVFLTGLSCHLLDTESCRCGDYKNRQSIVTDCISLTPDMIADLSWLPQTCAYRRVGEGRGLAWWHPLVSGDVDTVHQAGVSVRDWAVPETTQSVLAIEDYIIEGWPDEQHA
ncbi:MAG: YcgN family cysteine cluster protein [Pseudomonadota bacterium]